MADKLQVLYVDDEPGLLEIGRLFLELKGKFSVSTNTSAQDALALLDTTHFDAIISDYQMPGMDGIEFLKRVRASGNAIPFIIFTGRGREEIVIQALNEGADFYLQKGGASEAQFAELINKVRYAVERRKAEKEVSEAGELYNAFISVSHTGAWEYHADTGFLWCSPEYLSMLGRDASQFDFSGTRNLKETWNDLLHPEDRERADRHFKDYLHNGSPGMYENHFRMRHSDGHWVWIWSRGSTIRDREGNLTSKTIGTHIDVTESKLAEEAIRINNERLRMAQEIGQTGSWELDLATGNIWASEQAFRIFGVQRPDNGIISLAEVEARIPERERVHRALVDLLETGADYSLEYTIESTDNSGPKSVNSVARIIYDAGKKPASVVGVIHDITDRKGAEEALVRSTKFQESVINNAQVWLSVLDEKGKILVWNTAAEEISGYSAEEVIGKNDIWKMLYPDTLYRKQVTETISRIIHDKNYLENFETTILSKLGIKKVISWNTRIIPNITAIESDYIAIGVDITNRVRAEEALKTSQVRLSEAMDLAHLANWEFDVASGIFTFDDRFYALYGTSAEREGGCQMTADTYVREFVHPDDHGIVAREAKKAMNATDPGYVSQVEHRIIRRDGEVRHIIVSFGITKDAAGRTIKTHGANQDITERKLAEEAVIQVNEKLSRQTKSLLILSRIITTANKAINRQQLLAEILDETLNLLDYDAGGIYLVDPVEERAEIVCYNNIPDDFLREIGNVSIHVPPYDLLFSKGLPLFTDDYEQVAPEHFNKTGYYSLASVPLLSKNMVIGALNVASQQRRVISEDEQQTLISIGRELGTIIERMSAEEESSNASKALEESESRLNSIFRVAPVGIGVVINQVIQSVNDQFCQITGYLSEELLGKSVHSLYPAQDEHDAVGQVKCDQAAEKGHGLVETRFQKKDGTIVDVLLSSTPLDPSDLSVGVTLTVLDITERKRVEESLRQSEILLRSMIDSPQSIIIFSLDSNYRYLAFNTRHQETMKAIWGVDIRPGTHMLLEVIGYESDRKKAQRNFDRALAGDHFTLTEEYGDEALTRKVWEDTYSPIYDANHQVIGLTVYVIEVTEQKRAERVLRETERRMEDIINFLPDATFAIDDEGRVIAWNRAIEEMTGVRRENMLGKGNYEYALPFYGERRPILIDLVMMQDLNVLKNYTAVQKDGDALTAETNLALKGDKDIYLWGKSVLFKNSLGEVVGAIESIRDITDRKQAEELYQTVFENTGTAMIIVEENSIISHANDEMEKIWGYSREEIEGLVKWPALVVEEDRGKMLKYHNTRWKDPGAIPKDYEFRFIHKNGEVRDADLSVAIIPGTKKSIVSLRDITEMKKLDRQVKMRTEQVEQLLRQKDEFIAQAGHDLKTPLTPIIALLPHIYKKEQDPELRKLLAMVMSDAAGMKHLITDVLTLAKLNTISTTPDAAELALSAAVEKEITKHAWLIKKKGQVIENTVDPNTRIWIAQVHLESLLNNLIGNAIRYTPDGGRITISSRITKKAILISVIDTGIGLTPEETIRIFDEFYKADTSRHQRDSSGLGLSIVSRIAHLYGGHVKAESPGKGCGSTLTVTFPQRS